jgi:hypothetical protein
MNTEETEVSTRDVFAGDDLLQLEMLVARRADELSQDDRHRTGRDLMHWLQAEREVLRQVAPAAAEVG